MHKLHIVFQHWIAVLIVAAVPMTNMANAEEPAEWQYSMQSGESIWSIAHELLTDWRDWQTIERLNNVTNDRRMPPGSVLRIPRTLINEYDANIKVLDVSGTVTAEVVLKDGSVKAHLPLAKNQGLGQGDQIKTSEQSSVLLEFDDGTQVLVLEKSLLKVERASVLGNQRRVVDIKVFLESGEAEIRANPGKVPGSQFLIDTPAAFATTKGTQYRVRAEKQRTAAEVSEGLIEVANNLGDIRVRKGFGTVAQADQAPIKPKLLLAAPELPDMSATVRYLPGKLQWQAVPDAVAYRAQISPDAAFSTIVYDKRADVPKMGLPASLLDQPYWLRVSAISHDGLQGLAAVRAFNIDARPFPPVQQSPRASDSIYVGEVKFSWSRPETAAGFILEVAQDADFTQPLLRQEQITNTHFSLALEQPGQYFWRVTSVAADGEVGPVGFNGQFKVKPIPATPELQAPVSSDKGLFFSWGAEQGIKHYQLQFASDKAFKNILADTQTEQAEASIKKPEPGTYYLRVRAFDKDNYAGEWSAPQQVEQPIENWWPFIISGAATLLLML